MRSRLTIFAAAALALPSLGACLDGGELLGSDAGDTDEADAAVDPDRIDAACHGPERVPDPCGLPQVAEVPEVGADHIPEPTPIAYDQSPPSSGDHRPAWAKWGEYDYLAPQRWLHNLEHGGVALLYDPCAPAELVAALRRFARERPEDTGGEFRWVLTPYPGLPTPVAAVTWEWTWQAECVDTASLTTFVTDHYRQAPEDVPWDGSYSTGWQAR